MEDLNEIIEKKLAEINSQDIYSMNNCRFSNDLNNPEIQEQKKKRNKQKNKLKQKLEQKKKKIQSQISKEEYMHQMILKMQRNLEKYIRKRSLSSENESEYMSQSQLHQIIEKLQNLSKSLSLIMDYENFPGKDYYERDYIRKLQIRHFGQRKLFMSELFFLTKYGHLSNNVIYVGSAPGMHIPFLVSLFPNHNFILVDPNPFSIQECDRIKIINDYYTDDICQQHQQEFYNKGGTLFISDIRTIDVSMNQIQQEATIVKDNYLQQKWVQLLKPHKAMLKFRCPWNQVLNPNYIEMLKGDIYIQPWAPQSSTETRLITDANQPIIKYDNQEYEKKLFYHNDEIRINKTYEQPIQGEGIFNDFDSSADVLIIYEYLKKNPNYFENQNYLLEKQICVFSRILTKSIGNRNYLEYYNPPKFNRAKYMNIIYKQVNETNNQESQLNVSNKQILFDDDNDKDNNKQIELYEKQNI